jgi:hypothetical protein
MGQKSKERGVNWEPYHPCLGVGVLGIATITALNWAADITDLELAAGF